MADSPKTYQLSMDDSSTATQLANDAQNAKPGFWDDVVTAIGRMVPWQPGDFDQGLLRGLDAPLARTADAIQSMGSDVWHKLTHPVENAQWARDVMHNPNHFETFLGQDPKEFAAQALVNGAAAAAGPHLTPTAALDATETLEGMQGNLRPALQAGWNASKKDLFTGALKLGAGGAAGAMTPGLSEIPGANMAVRLGLAWPGVRDIGRASRNFSEEVWNVLHGGRPGETMLPTPGVPGLRWSNTEEGGASPPSLRISNSEQPPTIPERVRTPSLRWNVPSPEEPPTETPLSNGGKTVPTDATVYSPREREIINQWADRNPELADIAKNLNLAPTTTKPPGTVAPPLMRGGQAVEMRPSQIPQEVVEGATSRPASARAQEFDDKVEAKKEMLKDYYRSKPGYSLQQLYEDVKGAPPNARGGLTGTILEHAREAARRAGRPQSYIENLRHVSPETMLDVFKDLKNEGWGQ